MEGVNAEAEARFHAAAAFVRSDSDTVQLAQATKLQLYGLYKTATVGPCTVSQPSIFDQVGRAKHAAWMEHGKLSAAAAVDKYIALVETTCPKFKDSPSREDGSPCADEARQAAETPDAQGTVSVEDLMDEVTSLRRQLAARAAVTEDAAAESAGYLYQYQSKYSFRLGKWVLRYFVLDGDTLRVFKSVKQRHTHSPVESVDLRNCVVRYEGPKKRGKFHVLSVHLADSEHIMSHGGKLLLRASATTAEDAALWLEALQNAIDAVDNNDAEGESHGAPGTLGLASLEVADDGDPGAPPDAEPQLRMQLSERIAQGSHHLSERVKAMLQGAVAGSTAMPARQAFAASAYPPSRPMHRASKASLMSAAAGEQDYRGFLNLAGLLLIVVNFRMILENVKRYGLLLRVPSFSDRFEDWPCLTGIVCLNLHVLLALHIERLAARRFLPAMLAMGLHVLNVNAVLAIPCVVIFSPIVSSPPAASAYVFVATVLWLKLVSYVHVNQDWRRATGDELVRREAFHEDVKDAEGQVAYPDNLSHSDVYYFWCAPTLCYQLNFPRSERVRTGYVCTLLARICGVAGFIVFISEQYILPGVEASMESLESGSLLRIAERTLVLSVPTTYVWLLGFYLTFHLFFNLLAELLRFGDRVFYKDWWNATNIEAYWRLWNLPVHHWMVRHCYFPCLRLGLSKTAAIFCVFFLSAVFHELLVSVPFKTIRAWAFLAMMAQIPLVALSKMLDRFVGHGNKHVGNLVFWISFCILGQPFTVLLYYYDLSRQFAADAASGVEADSGAGDAVRRAVNSSLGALLGGSRADEL